MKHKWSFYKILKTASAVLAFIAIAWFVIAFMIVPVVKILQKAFFASGSFSTANITKVLSSRSIQKTIWNTLIMSLLTVLSVNVVEPVRERTPVYIGDLLVDLGVQP